MSDYPNQNFGLEEFMAEFQPTERQLEQLSAIALRKPRGEYWSNADLDLASFEAATIFATPKLSGLSLEAYQLLKLCDGRKWAFRFRREDDTKYSGPASGEIYEYGLARGLVRYSGTTYGDLLDKLLRSGLIEEAPLRQKLWGSHTVNTLGTLLAEHGLNASGSKDELLDRLFANIEQHELEAMTNNVVLFQATDKGKDAIRVLRALWLNGPGAAFRRAVLASVRREVGPT